MSEPPRPPGDNTPPDPTAPMPYGSDPASGYNPPPPSPPSYDPPPYNPVPPSSGAGGYPPPSSGAGGYPPGGGAPPPYGDPGYGTPPGYGPPGQGGYGAPVAGYPTSDDRTWALLAHFGGAVGAFVSGGPLGFVGPLIAYLVKGEQSPTVRAHALAALNFQLLWSVISFAVWFVSVCLLFIPSVVIFIFMIAMGIIAGAKAANGEPYKYPMTVNWIK